MQTVNGLLRFILGAVRVYVNEALSKIELNRGERLSDQWGSAIRYGWIRVVIFRGGNEYIRVLRTFFLVRGCFQGGFSDNLQLIGEV